ncbi:hypothetical protein [Microcystis sp. LSC13-02]|uniref:hypothetical protein n=1 Tax=Microcystis sp. LSC13-02 TaxID=1895004 RepID=UPI00257D7487|nr:hypothetical protein [Microcystis sp. LSC13-02]
MEILQGGVAGKTPVISQKPPPSLPKLPNFLANSPQFGIDILAAVKRTAIPHHATFLGWSRQWG